MTFNKVESILLLICLFALGFFAGVLWQRSQPVAIIIERHRIERSDLTAQRR
jgi:hypothetical protein